MLDSPAVGNDQAVPRFFKVATLGAVDCWIAVAFLQPIISQSRATARIEINRSEGWNETSAPRDRYV